MNRRERMFPVLGSVLGSATFWLRGSALWHSITKTGKTMGDLFWASCLTLLCSFAGFPLWLCPGLLIFIWLGGRLGWWGSLDMGTAHHTLMRDFLIHSARGFFWTFFAAAYLLLVSQEFMGEWRWEGSLIGPAILAFSGLTAGFSWWLGFKIRPPVYQYIPLPDGTTHKHYDANDQKRPWATEIGEIIYGFIIGGALLIAVTL